MEKPRAGCGLLFCVKESNGQAEDFSTGGVHSAIMLLRFMRPMSTQRRFMFCPAVASGDCCD